MENLVYNIAGTAIRSLDGFSEIQNIYSESYSVDEQALLDIAPAGSTAYGKLRDCYTVDGTFIDRSGFEKKTNGDAVGTDKYGYGNFVCEREYDESIGKSKNIWYPFLSGSKILNTLDIVNNLKDVATANQYDYVVDFLDFEVYNLANAELMYNSNNTIPNLSIGRTFIFPKINATKVYTIASFDGTGKPIFTITDIPITAYTEATKKVKVNFSGIASWVFNIDSGTVVGSKKYEEDSLLMVSGLDYENVTLSDLLAQDTKYIVSRLKDNTNSNFSGVVFDYNGAEYTPVVGSKFMSWTPIINDSWYALKNASFDPTDFHKLRVNVGKLRNELDPGKKRVILDMVSASTPPYEHHNFYSHSAYYSADVYSTGNSISFNGSGRGILRSVSLLKLNIILLQKDNTGVFQGKLEVPYDIILSADPTTEALSASITEGSFSKVGTVLHPKLTYIYSQTDSNIKFSLSIPAATNQQFICAAVIEDMLTPQYSTNFVESLLS